MRGARLLSAVAVLAVAAGALGRATSAPPALTVAVATRALQPGELVVLTITLDDAPSRLRVHVFDQDLAAFRQTDRVWVALVGIDIDRTPGRYVADVEAHVGATLLHASQPLVVAPKAFPTRRLRVDPSFVHPSAAELARIQQDAQFLRGVYAESAGDRLWTGPIVRPVSEPATSRFGTRSIFNGERRRPHAGADFLSPLGTPAGAPLGGRIVVARDLFFTGQTVIVDHGLGLFSLLAHLSRLDVHEGDTVVAGQRLGLVGATGRVTGPHLHWALTVSGARVDPMSALAILGRE